MGIWARARELAAATPATRNRYVDFLRALSILVVIFGHWLVATAWYHDGEFVTGHLLRDQPDTQWLTWLFQVMPVFFIVGGYSNAVSLDSAKRNGQPYANWIFVRLNRLILPLLLLLFVWAGIAFVMGLLDVRTEIIQYMSRASLIPTWFLAIYIMVAILAPFAWKLWQRFGYYSVLLFATFAILVDVAFFAADLRFLGWSNYFWVWLAVHQLGFAWREARLPGTTGRLVIGVLGFVALFLLITQGPYPLAMVGSPDEGLSNTLPPKITLLALGIAQFGFMLAIEQPMRRALDRVGLWTGTVLVNSMIMTVYLWHITVMIVFGGILYLGGGFGFGLEPGTGNWWLTRPVWIAVLTVLLVPLALLLSPFERRGPDKDSPAPPAVRQVPGAIMLCLGVALLAMYGFGGGPVPWLDKASFGLVIAGALLAGVLPNLKRS